ncbi:N-acetylmuramoyl-L-alanine amidase [Marivirga arenosa]|uniref:N-acetylmuramoyl-L-alanine amidase n=1 Tax=Marivirga arenosa TaxID=3059076 RepID=A0AA51ZVE4_9BACT|nr:N-acetylmuramoyl-L-alanine amidase [Marivirga sp. BKB1-2]WNB17455.1 N-acetylmuramoyl-L-alanine amidase [Marivirga sp. BKB1-2]
MFRIIAISCLVLSVSSLKAQQKRLTTIPIEISSNQRFNLRSNFEFTAIALKSKNEIDFKEISFLLKDESIVFQNSPHQLDNSNYFYSTIIHFNESTSELKLMLKNQSKLQIEAILINGEGNYASSLKMRRKQDSNNCQLEGVITQDEWRSGLAEPSYSRSFTDTENLIIHHSAGSNNITDYTLAVRNIYIFHTQENGWSDIGYNYLIAPNGAIYAGRDPAGGEQDLVIGAHFCGSNSTTMGVCLLGNYETVDPEQDMLNSLENLLSWKAFKDDLNALATNSHPLNSNLGVIAGHQDGCNTLCPGINVYEKLDEIRQNVDVQVSTCRGEDKPVIEIEFDTLLSTNLYPNPIRNNFSFNLELDENRQNDILYFQIFDQRGKYIKWEKLYFRENKIEVLLPNTLTSGIYFLQIVFNSHQQELQRFMIL